MGGDIVCAHDDSVAALGGGATANLVCFKWLGNHKSRSQRMGIPQVSAFPTMARSTFIDRRIGNVRFVADIKVGTAGRGGTFMAFAAEADIPAFLREGAPESTGGKLDFTWGVLRIRNHGEGIPLGANEMGHYVLSVVACDKGLSRVDWGPKGSGIIFRLGDIG